MRTPADQSISVDRNISPENHGFHQP